MLTQSSGVPLGCLRTLSSGTIKGPHQGGDKAPFRGPERKAIKHSAAGSDSLSRMSAGQATSSGCSHIDCSRMCHRMRHELADFIERESEAHLNQCTRVIIYLKIYRRIIIIHQALKKAPKKSGA